LTIPVKGKDRRREELTGLIEGLEGQLEALERDNPFWFYKPNEGELDETQKRFLEEYLKPEDIPQSVASQWDVHKSIANILIVSGGGQSGKSTSLAVETSIQSTGALPYALEGIYPKEKLPKRFPRNLRIVGIDAKQVMNTVIPTFQKWCPKEFLLNGSWADSFSVKQNKLFLFKDKKVIANIEFMTNQMDVESFQGPPMDFIGYDEEPRNDIYRENNFRFVTAERMFNMFAFTPTHGLTWATDLASQAEDEKQNKIALFKICTISNKKANLDVVRDIISQTDSYSELKMRLLGEFISISGLVYGNVFNTNMQSSNTNLIPPFFEDLEPIKSPDGKIIHDPKKDYLCIAGLDPHSVTPTPIVFMLVDREGNKYVDFCVAKTADTEIVKDLFHQIVKQRGYRMGWSVADTSSDSSIIAFGGKNIYSELQQGTNAIPALRKSEKYAGSIEIGVNEIKKALKINPLTNKPTLFIVNRPENEDLIQSFKTLERDTYRNEDVKGLKDKIREGKHHFHSALRYIFQFPINWYPHDLKVPELQVVDETTQY